MWCLTDCNAWSSFAHSLPPDLWSMEVITCYNRHNNSPSKQTHMHRLQGFPPFSSSRPPRSSWSSIWIISLKWNFTGKEKRLAFYFFSFTYVWRRKICQQIWLVWSCKDDKLDCSTKGSWQSAQQVNFQRFPAGLGNWSYRIYSTHLWEGWDLGNSRHASLTSVLAGHRAGHPECHHRTTGGSGPARLGLQRQVLPDRPALLLWQGDLL